MSCKFFILYRDRIAQIRDHCKKGEMITEFSIEKGLNLLQRYVLEAILHRV